MQIQFQGSWHESTLLGVELVTLILEAFKLRYLALVTSKTTMLHVMVDTIPQIVKEGSSILRKQIMMLQLQQQRRLHRMRAKIGMHMMKEMENTVM